MKRRPQMTSQSATSAKRTKWDQNEVDESAFGDLPEDVLLELFQRITSLPLRFSLAGVNRKFRKLMLNEIRKPMPLHLDMQTTVFSINGHAIKLLRWPQAIRALAEKTQFTEIIFSGESRISYAVYTALLSHLPSLEKLSKLQCDAVCISKWVVCQKLLELVANAPKLSILKLDLANSWLPILPGSTEKYKISELQLAQTLSNKPLTEVDLKFRCNYPKEFVELFQSIQPNTLRKLTLMVRFEMSGWRKDFCGMFETLRKDAWSELETIHGFIRDGRACIPATDAFFKQLRLFPKLRECSFTLDHDMTYQELTNYIVGYLKHHGPLPQKHIFNANFSKPPPIRKPSCGTVDVLKRVQAAIEDVDFSMEILGTEPVARFSIGLTHQNATFKLVDLIATDCQCDICRGFHPVMFMKMKSMAKQMTSGGGHLENYRLDRCKIGRLVNDLNVDGYSPLALSVLTNHDATVSVTFGAANHEFIITVGTDHCFSDACIGCVIV